MISQFLSSTIRTITVYNASTRSILPVVSTNIHRTVHSSQFQRERLSPNVRKLVEKIMGSRPKQPLPPYFRFVQQIRPQVVAEHPHLKQNELYKIFSERWKSLEANEKAILSTEYRNDMQKYSEEISNYNDDMSAADKLRLEEELKKSAEKNLIKSYRRRARELNKPKKPPSSFLRFLHAQTDRRSDETQTDFLKRMSSRWNALSETLRKEYETKPREKAEYKKAMLAWEANLQRSSTVGGDGLCLLKFSHDQCDQENLEDDEYENL